MGGARPPPQLPLITPEGARETAGVVHRPADAKSGESDKGFDGSSDNAADARRYQTVGAGPIPDQHRTGNAHGRSLSGDKAEPAMTVDEKGPQSANSKARSDRRHQAKREDRGLCQPYGYH